MRWYSKYLEVYNKPFTDEQDAICKAVKKQIGKLQAENPVVTVSVIAYNEERHLLACLWALASQSQPVKPLRRPREQALAFCGGQIRSQ